MQQQIVAADVDDEGNGGAHLRDVGEILVRPDADVRAACHAAVPQGGDDVQVGLFIRDKIVGVEIAAALGELRHAAGKPRGRLNVDR
ncbi:MAG: hypothetical protein A3H95_01070 [Acidobacteria bacterium RIFCSPLOWO2_02_FULL_64_15]|nr:MAG: hypothetical protein A3H95_01070 [Acidobacteria bacterium RIFCSPLOWO2_02_FULL_64_15]